MDRNKVLGPFGVVSLLYGVVEKLTSALSKAEDINRWREMIGPVSQEGLSQLAIIVGLLLLAPSLGALASNRYSSWRMARQDRKEAQRLARSILPHMEQGDIDELMRLVNEGPCPSEHPPREFAYMVGEHRRSHTGGQQFIYAILEGLHSLIRNEVRRRKLLEEKDALEEVKEALRSPTKAQRVVLFAFARPNLLEPFALLKGKLYKEAIAVLERAGVLVVEKKRFEVHSASERLSCPSEEIPKRITLSERSRGHVQKFLGDHAIQRTSIEILGGD